MAEPDASRRAAEASPIPPPMPATPACRRRARRRDSGERQDPRSQPGASTGVKAPAKALEVDHQLDRRAGRDRRSSRSASRSASRRGSSSPTGFPAARWSRRWRSASACWSIASACTSANRMSARSPCSIRPKAPSRSSAGRCRTWSSSAAKPARSPEPQEASVNFIKRIVGGPGDTISIVEGHVIRNGKREKDSYIRQCGSSPECNFPDADQDSRRSLVHDGGQSWRIRRQQVLGTRPHGMDHRRSHRHLLAPRPDRDPLAPQGGAPLDASPLRPRSTLTKGSAPRRAPARTPAGG